jgi:hypothetical protein
MGASHSSAPSDPVTHSITCAITHTSELKSPCDRCNADAVLSRLRIQQDQPMGWKSMAVCVRPQVLDYMRNHGILVHNARPCATGMMCGTVVV